MPASPKIPFEGVFDVDPKMLSGVLFASVFALGCGSDESSAPQDQVRQEARGMAIPAPTTTSSLGQGGESWIRALLFDGSKWYLSTQTDQTYAAVSASPTTAVSLHQVS